MNPLTSFGTFERTDSSDSSVVRATQICERLGFTLALSSAGTTIHTTTCLISDRNGRTSTGKGKGIGSQSEASAIFEALEHYHYINEQMVVSTPFALDIQGTDSILNGASPDFNLICASREIPLCRLHFYSLSQNADDLLFPAFLTNPYYESSHDVELNVLNNFHLLRYSTNSGTASGLSETEAILHGLLEIIERDSIGIELIRTVVRRDPLPVRQLCLKTLPQELQALCCAVSIEARAIVELWDITTDVGVPTILAALSTGTDTPRKYFGSGASLSRSYAVERALLEALQGFHNYTAFNIPQPLFGATDYVSNSLFQRCYLEAGHFEYRGGQNYVHFDELSCPVDCGQLIHPSVQLNFIISKLLQMGFNIYWRPIYMEDIFVVQVVVPQFERFHLVAQGIPVLPARRGRQIL